MRKIILPAFLLTGALAVGALGFTKVAAQEVDYPPIIDKLVERFGLDPEAVQDVFEEERAERHAEMLANFEDRLSEAVESGKITEEQKQLILDKHEEMQAKMEELKSQDLTRDEMHEQMRSYHEELKTWAEDNGIEFPFMVFKFGHGHHKGAGAGMIFEEKLD